MSKVKLVFSGLEVRVEGTETTEQLLNMSSSVMVHLIDMNYKAMIANRVTAPLETEDEAPEADTAPQPQPLDTGITQGAMYA